MKITRRKALSTFAVSGTVLAAGWSATPATAVAADASDRQVLFGELHLHTGFSFDACAFMGTRTTPDDALHFVQGEPITVLGHKVQRPRPLDFAAVTDHSEYLGVIKQLVDSQSPLAQSALGQRLREHPFETFMEIDRGIETHQDAPELRLRFFGG